MKEKNRPERRLIQEKIAKMLRERILEASDIENGEPVLRVTEKALKEKIEAEISEQNMDKKEIIEVLINKFLKSGSSYGEITKIEGDVQSVYDLIRNYVYQKRLDIYALKFEDKILLSRTNFEFENIQKAVKRHCALIAKKDMIELWDDEQNKILHLFIAFLRKHFPIGYINEENKLEIIEGLSA